MAAVSQTSSPTRHIVGDLALRVFTFTGASGSTLDTGMKNILYVGTSPGSLITAVAIVQSTGQLTITSSGPMTGETLLVLARVG